MFVVPKEDIFFCSKQIKIRSTSQNPQIYYVRGPILCFSGSCPLTGPTGFAQRIGVPSLHIIWGEVSLMSPKWVGWALLDLQSGLYLRCSYGSDLYYSSPEGTITIMQILLWFRRKTEGSFSFFRL